MLSLRTNIKRDGGASESARSPMRLSSVGGILHHLQRVPHVAGKHLLLEHLKLLSIGTVLTLAPRGPALPGLQSPVNRKHRWQHLELITCHVHLVNLQEKRAAAVTPRQNGISRSGRLKSIRTNRACALAHSRSIDRVSPPDINRLDLPAPKTKIANEGTNARAQSHEMKGDGENRGGFPNTVTRWNLCRGRSAVTASGQTSGRKGTTSAPRFFTAPQRASASPGSF